MDRRGVTFLEVLIVVSIGTVILLGIGAFYWQMTRSLDLAEAQAALQRQGTLVQQEMARIIQPADGLLPGTCGPDTAGDSVPVRIPAGALPDAALAGGAFVCFYLDADLLAECRFESASSTACVEGSVRNLLAGAPIREPIRAAPVPGRPVFTRVGGTAVEIDFGLSAGPIGPLTFHTRFNVRN